MKAQIPDPAAEPTITAERAADLLGISARSVYRHMDAGQIPSIRVGRSKRVHTARFLAAYGFTRTPTAA